MLTGAFSGAALFTYVAASPDILIGVFHVPPSRFGLFFGVNAFGLIGATQINARLARRVPFEVILQWANLAVFAASLLLAFDAVTGFGGLWGVMVPMFLVMASFGFNQSNATVGALGVDQCGPGRSPRCSAAASFAAGAAAALAGFSARQHAAHGLRDRGVAALRGGEPTEDPRAGACAPVRTADERSRPGSSGWRW